MQQKKAELVAAACVALDDILPEAGSARLAKRVLDSFASLTAPEKTPEDDWRLITVFPMNDDGPRAKSLKPGNLVLNWRRLMDVGPDVALAAIGAAAVPRWAWFLVALYIWNKTWRGMEEHLGDAEATTIWGLWQNKNAEHRISEEQGFIKVNELRSGLGLQPLNENGYQRAVNKLLELDCITMSDGVIWLREWVRVTY